MNMYTANYIYLFYFSHFKSVIRSTSYRATHATIAPHKLIRRSIHIRSYDMVEKRTAKITRNVILKAYNNLLFSIAHHIFHCSLALYAIWRWSRRIWWNKWWRIKRRALWPHICLSGIEWSQKSRHQQVSGVDGTYKFSNTISRTIQMISILPNFLWRRVVHVSWLGFFDLIFSPQRK